MPILILFAFIMVPIAEIAVLIEVGEIIGTWPTIGLVVGTAVLGSALIRAQGIGIINRARANLAKDTPPVGELFEGICLILAGAFLLTPGFVTDSVGFLLLVPGLRRGVGNGIWRFLQRRTTVQSWAGHSGATHPGRMHPGAGPMGPGASARPGDSTVIDGEFREVDADNEPRRPNSPWSEKS